MGHQKDFDRQQKQGGGRKNNEEVGEPVQLNNDKSNKQGQQGKPGMGQRDGDHGGQHQGGGTANR